MILPAAKSDVTRPGNISIVVTWASNIFLNDKIVVILSCWVISDCYLPLGVSESDVTLGEGNKSDITCQHV